MNKSLCRLSGKILKASWNISEKAHRVSNDVQTAKNLIKLSNHITFVAADDLLGESLGRINAVPDLHATEFNGSILYVWDNDADSWDESTKQLDVEASTTQFFEIKLSR